MSINLTEHETVVIDVHTVRDRTALVVNGELLWMTRREIDALRHKLMLAVRAMEFATASAPIPTPRKRR